MQEALITTVFVPHDEREHELQIRYTEDAIIEVYLDGKKIFTGDWHNNLHDVFQRALELWKVEE